MVIPKVLLPVVCVTGSMWKRQGVTGSMLPEVHYRKHIIGSALQEMRYRKVRFRKRVTGSTLPEAGNRRHVTGGM